MARPLASASNWTYAVFLPGSPVIFLSYSELVARHPEEKMQKELKLAAFEKGKARKQPAKTFGRKVLLQLPVSLGPSAYLRTPLLPHRGLQQKALLKWQTLSELLASKNDVEIAEGASRMPRQKLIDHQNTSVRLLTVCYWTGQSRNESSMALGFPWNTIVRSFTAETTVAVLISTWLIFFILPYARGTKGACWMRVSDIIWSIVHTATMGSNCNWCRD